MKTNRIEANLVAGLTTALVVVVLSLSALTGCGPLNKDVILATTTSTRDTGLLDALIPVFEEKTGYRVKTVAVGTGQALAMGEKGEADVMLVHAPASEVKLVESGDAANRKLVMHNDFVLVGTNEDLAGVRGETSAATAFARIAEKGGLFVSRGDDSGTHKKELEVWKAAGVAFESSGPQPYAWYQETGSGMGQTLNIASEKGAYTLTDRGTYLALRKNLALEVLVEGDKVLLNIYHVMQVNPEKHSKVNGKGGAAFVEFMVSAEAQKLIGEFGKEEFGQPLFFPDAGKPAF